MAATNDASQLIEGLFSLFIWYREAGLRKRPFCRFFIVKTVSWQKEILISTSETLRSVTRYSNRLYQYDYNNPGVKSQREELKSIKIDRNRIDAIDVRTYEKPFTLSDGIRSYDWRLLDLLVATGQTELIKSILSRNEGLVNLSDKFGRNASYIAILFEQEECLGSFFLDYPNRRTKLRTTDLRYRETVFRIW